MIGFSNAIYDEYRSIDNCRNFIQYEQLVNDEVKKRKKKYLKWIKLTKRTPNTDNKGKLFVMLFC